jgi:uncharacterized protein involved in exopolysaccharide biosynthesis
MLTYLETFYRHRLLLISPLILALIASIALVLIQPRTYEATASLRFQPTVTDASDPTTVPATSNILPADLGAASLKELLKTRSFAARVGRQGPLAGDLVARDANGDLPSQVLRLLRGNGGSALSNPAALDDLLVTTLNQKVTAVSVGPQVVTLSFDYPDAAVAAATLKGIIDQLTLSLTEVRRSRAQAAVDFYKQRVDTQSAEVTAADSALSQYWQTHPAQRAPGATPTATQVSLQQNDDVARQRYQDMVRRYDLAQADLAQAVKANAAGFDVIDPPIVPYRAKGLMKSLLLAGFGGLFLGLLLALFGLMALTAIDTSAHRPEEIDTQLGHQVVGSIPRLR